MAGEVSKIALLEPRAREPCLYVMKNEDKRRLRQLKRDIKRAGNKRRRQHLKRELRERPEDAPHSAFDFGRSSSSGLNRLDNDSTRRKQQNCDLD